MFATITSDLLDSKFATILGEPKILLFDVVPILFTGKNHYGSYVIGSSVIEDDGKGYARFFHIVVSYADFRAFHGGEVSYLDLLRKSRPIYVLDKRTDSDEENVTFVQFEDIPEEYRPTTQTFFPDSAREVALTYSTKIAGGSADYHLADPRHVSTIQNQISTFLERSLHTLQTRLGFDVETKLLPATASSYGINFVISLPAAPLLAPADRLLDFVNEFTEFCFEHLPNEIDAVLDKQTIPDSHFESLVDKALSLAPIMAKNDEDLAKRTEELRNDLRRDVLSIPPVLEPVAEIIRSSYTSLEINNESMPLATVNNTFSDSLNGMMSKLNEETVDDRLRSFRITVYSFNKHSGKGRAEVLIDEDITAIWIHVLEPAFEEGEVNPYIESMRTDNRISVVGRMTYHGKKPYRLET